MVTLIFIYVNILRALGRQSVSWSMCCWYASGRYLLP